MADDEKGAPAPTTPPTDEIKNFKAEMGRKFENTQATLNQVLEQLRASTKPAAAASSEESLDDILYKNPAEFARRVKESATKEINEQLSKDRASTAKYQTVVSGLLNEYPESGDESSELMVRAKEIFGGLGDDDRTSPLAMKTAVTQAASELGIRPKSKRPKNDDDAFSLGGGGSSSRSESGERRRASNELDERTKQFAEAVGLDLDDVKNKDAKERIKNKHGKKDYNKWGKV